MKQPQHIALQQVVERLNNQLDELERLTDSALVRAESVSKWSVGQQIEHALISISGVMLALRKEHPGTGSRTPNMYRELVLREKSFPRGAVEAPAIARPGDNPERDFIKRLLLKTRNRLGDPLELSEKATIIHPIMDVMYRDEVIEFMAIHTAHHIDIIHDILKAEPS